MSLRKLLIANRGEIAVRIIAACRDLGVESIAVFSDIDRDAEFVHRADHAYHLGPSEARLSYLDGAKIIDVARRAGADAVHPGYGFLAENAEFAQACLDAGLVFVGPSPAIIAQMGSKIAAKDAAIAAGVPVVPGFQKDGASEEELVKAAAEIGFPLLIKASAGGGGRGMRVVRDADHLSAELSLARQEAQSAFGDDAVLLEKYLPISRHIEVQIVADTKGAVRHAFERDCSIQRHHQKVLEEAPAPDLSDPERAAILEDAVRLAAGIGYDSVGTVEFIFDPAERRHYFLEMNTRLQVEHPVTECVTGLDLAALQIRMAAGDPVPYQQAELACTGWAIEARVAAEDASEGYRPATGVIDAYEEPDGPGLRIDSGVRSGSMVSHFYDSMLAKLIAQGPDRDTARRRLAAALSDYRITGVETNTAFLADILTIDAFAAGTHNTGTLTEIWPDGWQKPRPTDRDLAEAALVKTLSLQAPDCLTGDNPWSSLGAWRVTERVGRAGTAVFYADCGKQLRVSGRGDAFTVMQGETTVLEATNVSLQDGVLRYETVGQVLSCPVSLSNKTVQLRRRSGPISINLSLGEEALLNEAGEGDGSGLTAGMPGQVVEICVAVGDTVEKGQKLVVLEAMKLLQALTAPTDGIVEAIHYQTGDSVEGGAVLLSIDADS